MNSKPVIRVDVEHRGVAMASSNFIDGPCDDCTPSAPSNQVAERVASLVVFFTGEKTSVFLSSAREDGVRYAVLRTFTS